MQMDKDGYSVFVEDGSYCKKVMPSIDWNVSDIDGSKAPQQTLLCRCAVLWDYPHLSLS